MPEPTRHYLDLERLKSMVAETLELAPHRRASWIADHAGDDAILRAEVERLVAAHERAGDAFLPDEPSAAEPLPAARIGPYRLVRRLGEGGFGEVFLASQDAPVRREVALKLVKAGVANRQVLQRFEAERQSLAMMEHDAIARVYDGGTVPAVPPSAASGRPYFVMELVRDGLPITAYCDRHAMSIAERLALFVVVCRAVAHAHQRGVIHRDLKPSNVLVSDGDAGEGLGGDRRPRPKVIDFGIAKAIDASFAGPVGMTESRQLIGTPQYMSPEQATHGAATVDTRADVYSLGAILNELLCGSPPFEMDDLPDGSVLQLLNVLADREPPSPSTRLAASHDAQDRAGRRRADRTRLVRDLRGDLDWIVARCLEKEPARRYDSANALADDIEAHAADLPVQAGPPSRMYRFRKLARRHRGALASVVVATIAIAVGIAALIYSLVAAHREQTKTAVALADARAARAVADERRAEAETQRGRAEQARKSAETSNAFLLDMLRAADPMHGIGKDATVRQVVDAAKENVATRFADRPESEWAIRNTLGWTYRGLGDIREALAQAERRVAIARDRLGGTAEFLIPAQIDLAQFYVEADRVAEADDLYKAIAEHIISAFGESDGRTLTFFNNYGSMLAQSGRAAEAIPVLRRLVELRRKANGPESSETAMALANLALAQGYTPDHVSDGLATLDEAIRLWAKTLGVDHPYVLQARELRADLLTKTGDNAAAIATWRDMLKDARRVLGDEHPLVIRGTDNLANTLMDTQALDEAAAILAPLLETSRRVHGPGHRDTLHIQLNLALTRERMEKLAEAAALLEDYWNHLPPKPDPLDDRAAVAATLLAELAEKQHDPQMAAHWQAEAARAIAATQPSSVPSTAPSTAPATRPGGQ